MKVNRVAPIIFRSSGTSRRVFSYHAWKAIGELGVPQLVIGHGQKAK